MPAFIGAMGWGRDVTGGRGGSVYRVTDRRDYLANETPIPGTLRYGLANLSGPTIFTFERGGTIQLCRELVIQSKNDITLSGQASPGNVVIQGYHTTWRACSNIMIRYLTFRCGDFNATARNGLPTKGNGDQNGGDGDACDFADGDGIMVDHCTFMWGMDEISSPWICKNVTVSNCILAYGFHQSYHPNGNHSKTVVTRGNVTPTDRANFTGGITWCRNLVAHAATRNPAINARTNLAGSTGIGDFEICNNVIYNWGTAPGMTEGDGTAQDYRMNFCGNMYIAGPSTTANATAVFSESAGSAPADRFYHGGTNYIDSDKGGTHNPGVAGAGAYLFFDNAHKSTPWPFPLDAAGQILSATDAYDYVLANAGNRPLDHHATVVVNDVINRTGAIINSQTQLTAKTFSSGLSITPTGATLAPVFETDTDGDGMPDWYEDANGLDKNNAADAVAIAGNGLSYLENYLAYRRN